VLAVPNRDLPPTGVVLVLNPLHELPLAIDPARLRFELTFGRPDGDERATAIADAASVVYKPRICSPPMSATSPSRTRAGLWCATRACSGQPTGSAPSSARWCPRAAEPSGAPAP